jgi:hypothetical protein
MDISRTLYNVTDRYGLFSYLGVEFRSLSRIASRLRCGFEVCVAESSFSYSARSSLEVAVALLFPVSVVCTVLRVVNNYGSGESKENTRCVIINRNEY